MAKITIAGNAAVITSSIKMEDLKTAKKYRPEALVLKGGEDGKEPIFAVDVACQGSLNQYGITFDSVANDGSGNASVTIAIANKGDDVKEAFADATGVAISNLNKVEAQLLLALEEIDADKAAVMESITVIA